MKFVKRIPAILKLIVKNIEFLTIGVDVGATVEMEIDVSPFTYINCSLSSKYIVQYTVSPLL